MGSFTVTAPGDSRTDRRLRAGLLFLRSRQQSNPTPILQPIALAADVDRGRVVQQTGEDSRRDDGLSEDRAPVAVTLIAGQNDAAALVAGADQLEEDGRTEIVQGQISHLM
jgi:hypothetical protein